MRIVSRVLAVIGFLVLVVGGVMLAKNAIDINQLHAVANANRSTPFYSPLNDVLITASLAAGASLTAVRDGLAQMINVAGRLRAEPGPAGSTIFDDSYNANPGSLNAAIDTLAAASGENWLVLGDMGEVGDRGPEFHAEVGRHAAASGLEAVWTAGAQRAFLTNTTGCTAMHRTSSTR